MKASAKLEEVLRHRYKQLNVNINYDKKELHEYRELTALVRAEHKRHYRRLQDRQQVELYKRDELRLVAQRADIEL